MNKNHTKTAGIPCWAIRTQTVKIQHQMYRIAYLRRPKIFAQCQKYAQPLPAYMAISRKIS